MYEGDSFFTLTVGGQIGLLVLSTLMAVFAVWLVWRLTWRRTLLLRILIAALVWFGFIWLAPQVYYSYYLFLFDNLPLQIVIQSPLGISDLLALLFFQDNQNLSFHAQGALGWLLFAAGLFGSVQPFSR